MVTQRLVYIEEGIRYYYCGWFKTIGDTDFHFNNRISEDTIVA